MEFNSKAALMCKKSIAFILAFFMLITIFSGLLSENFTASAAPSKIATRFDKILAASERKNAYSAYAKNYNDKKTPIATIDVPVTSPAEIKDGASIKPDCLTKDGKGDAVVFDDQGSVSYKVNVEKEGMYKIALGYYTFGDDARDIDFTLKINGEVPFSSISKYSISRIWQDDTEITQDENGNDARPKQNQFEKWREMTLFDLEGVTGDYYFYFKEGENTIDIDIARAGMVLQSFKIFNDKETVPYSEYIAKIGSHPVVHSDLIEAENYIYKSNSSIIQSSDRSGPDTSPNDPVKLRINTISGSSWSKPGQYLTYSFHVPKDGNYYFGFRFKQDTIKGMFVTRKVLIDGNVAPFAEYENLKFQFSDKWQYVEPGDGTNPYMVYLKEGTHTISIEVAVGDSTQIISELQDIIYVLNYLYRRITMITGQTPDSYRDYALAKDIPELIPAFKDIVEKLNALSAYIEETTGKKGGNATVIKQLSKQLSDFIEDDFTIPERLNSYAANISSISALMTLLQSQPMSLDYITVMGEGSVATTVKNNFFQKTWYHMRAFIGSFFNDYSMLGKEKTGTKTIDVWYNGGREQAEIVRRMIDDDFTPSTGIQVNLKLVQIGLANAIIAKTAPDLVMNVSRGQPVNLGARGALEDLTQFGEKYDEVMSRFVKGAGIPYSFDGKAYGIPVTQNYFMLFTRDDVLSEIGLEVPQTWDDVYNVISILQRNNMSFGLPYTAMSSQGTIDAGMGSKDIFPTLVFQKGGNIYNEDKTATVFDSKEVVDAFNEWTKFYTDYGLDVQFDFYNRFRTGEMPIGIAGFGQYNLLDTAAPEIRGMWSMHLIPGTKKADGTIDRTTAGSGSAAVMVKGTENKNESWEFISWWTGKEAQSRYGIELEILMGSASRYDTANNEAMELLPWAESELVSLRAQRAFVREVEEIPGGYYTSRNLDNAFRNVVFNRMNPRESLLEQNIGINSEITKKRKEFGLDE